MLELSSRLSTTSCSLQIYFIKRVFTFYLIIFSASMASSDASKYHQFKRNGIVLP